MKFLITYLLLGIFFLNLFDVGLLILNFEINRSYFASLCINKDKKEMHCNGHCQLEKQIKAQEEKKSDKEKLINQKETPPFLCPCIHVKPSTATPEKESRLGYMEQLQNHRAVRDIFHPPRV